MTTSSQPPQKTRCLQCGSRLLIGLWNGAVTIQCPNCKAKFSYDSQASSGGAAERALEEWIIAANYSIRAYDRALRLGTHPQAVAARPAMHAALSSIADVIHLLLGAKQGVVIKAEEPQNDDATLDIHDPLWLFDEDGAWGVQDIAEFVAGATLTNLRPSLFYTNFVEGDLNELEVLCPICQHLVDPESFIGTDGWCIDCADAAGDNR